MGAAPKGLLAVGFATLAVATVNLGWLDLFLAPRALGATLIDPPAARPAPGPQPTEPPPAPEPEPDALSLQARTSGHPPSSAGDGPCDASAEVSREVHFDSASAALDERATTRVAAFVRHPLVKDGPGLVVIEGHADRRGDPERNEMLALERARAVAARLRDLGLAAPIELRSFGARRPVAPESKHRRNRRALICLMKETGS